MRVKCKGKIEYLGRTLIEHVIRQFDSFPTINKLTFLSFISAISNIEEQLNMQNPLQRSCAWTF